MKFKFELENKIEIFKEEKEKHFGKCEHVDILTALSICAELVCAGNALIDSLDRTLVKELNDLNEQIKMDLNRTIH